MTTKPDGSRLELPERWPQGWDPRLHDDPEWWLGWLFYPARWLLSTGKISVDLWVFEAPAPLRIALRRAEAIRPALNDRLALGLDRALEDIYRPVWPWPSRGAHVDDAEVSLA